MSMTLNLPNEGKDWLKLAGGIAAGIGTVAALPIFGTIGTVTALGAVLGGLAGAGVQLIDSDKIAAPTVTNDETTDVAPRIRQNLFASAATAQDYDHAISLLHSVVAWATANDAQQQDAARHWCGRMWCAHVCISAGRCSRSPRHVGPMSAKA